MSDVSTKKYMAEIIGTMALMLIHLVAIDLAGTSINPARLGVHRRTDYGATVSGLVWRFLKPVDGGSE